MKKRERFLRTIERREVDRPASWLGVPTAGALPELLHHFAVSDLIALKERIADDVWPVDLPYQCAPHHHIACAFDFARKRGCGYEERTLTEPGFFEDCEDSTQICAFPWPNPEEHMSSEACAAAVRGIPDDYAALGVMWSAHFQDACSAFGMENALMTMIAAPEMFQAVIDRIIVFYLQANEIFYEAARDRLDAVLIGNDLGTQRGLLISPELIRRFVFPGTKQLVEQAKSYGFKVLHHSCGAIREIIPDLIALGVDAIHPIQALAKGMEAQGLRRDFGNDVSFCGGVDAQDLLVNGTPSQVAATIAQLRALFPTGLIVSPSHEAILPDMKPENIAAIFTAIR